MTVIFNVIKVLSIYWTSEQEPIFKKAKFGWGGESRTHIQALKSLSVSHVLITYGLSPADMGISSICI